MQVPFTLKNPLINCVFFSEKKNTKNYENAKTSSLVQHHSCEQIMPIFCFDAKGRVEDSPNAAGQCFKEIRHTFKTFF